MTRAVTGGVTRAFGGATATPGHELFLSPSEPTPIMRWLVTPSTDIEEWLEGNDGEVR